MNLRFVEAFYWVASLKSISRAAEKLHLTQSAMSSRIAKLEEELGVLLLDRSDKQFKLTRAGDRFLVHAKRMLELHREAKEEMATGVVNAVSIRIGANESVLHSWLIPWLEVLRKQQPGLELELTVETTPILNEQIQRGSLDATFAVLPSTADGVRSYAFTPMEMAFFGQPERHDKAHYRLDELAELELLTFQKGSQPNVTLTELFKQNRLQPKKVHSISSISAMVQLVQAGFGVALLPSVVVERLAGIAHLKKLACAAPIRALPIYASYRTDPTSNTIETVVQSAIVFVEGAGNKAEKSMKGKPLSSKKSMI